MKILGFLTTVRSGVFELAAAIVYFVGWYLGAQHFYFALAAFAGSVVLLGAGALREEDRKKARSGVALIAAVFVLPALIVLVQSRMELFERERFQRYLAEHRCEYAGEAVVGMSPGGCRYEECVDPEPIEDQQFLCSVTGKYITFTGFKEGAYGR